MSYRWKLVLVTLLLWPRVLCSADFDDPQADRNALPTVPAGFEVTMFAREPLVRQPCSLAFDVSDIAAFVLAQKFPTTSITTAAIVTPAATSTATGPAFSVDEKSDRLLIQLHARPAAEFVFHDPQILRPYFANISAAGDFKVTRNQPPLAGQDATDHETMHPGVWLGFGDISGNDYWRNKARIEHLRFVEKPTVEGERLAFATESQLQAVNGEPLCRLINRFTLRARPAGWLLVWDATFEADKNEITFGDQEEMGFGARVATPLTEKNGGRIVNSAGQMTAAKTWGQPAGWCDYSGVVDGQRGGILLMSAPANFRASWWHNRDYGVFVANPFGRAAMKQGAPSAVTVKRGESLQLVYGAMFHHGDQIEPAVEYAEFSRVAQP